MPKALIATDGSDFALAAATRAKELLDPALEFTLLTVVPPPVLPVAAPVTGVEAAPIATPETTEELTEAFREEAEASLDRTAEASSARGRNDCLAGTSRRADGETRTPDPFITSDPGAIWASARVRSDSTMSLQSTRLCGLCMPPVYLADLGFLDPMQTPFGPVPD